MANSFQAAASRLIGLCVLASVAHFPALARIVGADDRAALPLPLEASFSGVGRLVCRDPGRGERFSTTATLVGNRSTLVATGHYGRVKYSAGASALFAGMQAIAGPRRAARLQPQLRHGIRLFWWLLYIMTPAGPRAVGINHGLATERDWNYGQVIGSDMIGHLPEAGVDATP